MTMHNQPQERSTFTSIINADHTPVMDTDRLSNTDRKGISTNTFIKTVVNLGEEKAIHQLHLHTYANPTSDYVSASICEVAYREDGASPRIEASVRRNTDGTYELTILGLDLRNVDRTRVDNGYVMKFAPR